MDSGFPALFATGHPPVALSIAGSDCSAGAGIQADLKTFSVFGVYGLTAVTCVVSETCRTVRGIEAVSPALLRDQISLMLDSFPVAAIKTGMLFSPEHVRATLDSLRDYTGPVIVDPVMVASTGDALLAPDAVDLYRAELVPRATLITPNLDEAAVLLNRETRAGTDMLDHEAADLCERFGVAVLLKGGHLGGETAHDILHLPDGRAYHYEAPFVRGFSTHGTGCTLSAAVAAGLARGLDLPAAVVEAKRHIQLAIARSLAWPGGHDALNHFPGPES